MFNKGGRKVKGYATTQLKNAFWVLKEVHTHPNLLTSDKLNQGSQIFRFKAYYETLIFIENHG